MPLIFLTARKQPSWLGAPGWGITAGAKPPVAIATTRDAWWSRSVVDAHRSFVALGPAHEFLVPPFAGRNGEALSDASLTCFPVTEFGFRRLPLMRFAA